jgi:hypothetical protein
LLLAAVSVGRAHRGWQVSVTSENKPTMVSKPYVAKVVILLTDCIEKLSPLHGRSAKAQ